MTTFAHVVPVEAVRYSVTTDGFRTLAQLASQRAALHADSTVELTERGWVATVIYTLPSSPKRVHQAHVMLAWTPAESAGRAAA